MATQYDWSFDNFETDKDNKVMVIHYRLTATDGDYSASMYGTDGQSELNFDTMSKEDAVACVLEHTETTEADMKANLDAQIASQKAPTLTTKTKEW